jgi:hypothetical protein
VKIGRFIFFAWLLNGCAGGLTLDPSKGYVGVDDSAATYKLPFYLTGVHNVRWTSSDMTVASVTGDDFIGIVIGNRAGTVTIHAETADANGSANVTVESYKAADRMAGAASAMTLGCQASGCHDAAGPDISPSTCGKHSASEILDSIRKGINPEGGQISTGAAPHSFAAPDSIVAWVRSLEPAGIPIHDH